MAAEPPRLRMATQNLEPAASMLTRAADRPSHVTTAELGTYLRLGAQALREVQRLREAKAVGELDRLAAFEAAVRAALTFIRTHDAALAEGDNSISYEVDDFIDDIAAALHDLDATREGGP